MQSNVNLIEHYENKIKIIIEAYTKSESNDKQKQEIFNLFNKYTNQEIVSSFYEEESQNEEIEKKALWITLKHHIQNLKFIVNQIATFQDLNLLGNVSYYYEVCYDKKYHDFYSLLDYLSAFFDLYNELKLFKISGIDETNYSRELLNLDKEKEKLQKYSSQRIKLDKLPKHPSDVIILFLKKTKIEKEHQLDFINKVVLSLGYRYKGAYKKLPHPSDVMKNNHNHLRYVFHLDTFKFYYQKKQSKKLDK